MVDTPTVIPVESDFLESEGYEEVYKEDETLKIKRADLMVRKALGFPPRRFSLYHMPGKDLNDPRNKSTVLFVAGMAHGTELTSNPAIFREHQLEIPGDPNKFHKQQFTCSRRTGRCAFCEAGNVPYQAGAYTIVELREFSFKGEVYRNLKKLLIMKTPQLLAMDQRAKRRGGSLVGAKFEVTRFGEKSARTGSDWDFIEKLDLNELKLVNGKGEVVELTAFDYRKALRPLDYDNQKAWLSGAPLNVPDAIENTANRNEEVPF